MVKEVYHDSALISWEPPADGGKPITGYIMERKETMANRYSFGLSSSFPALKVDQQLALASTQRLM